VTLSRGYWLGRTEVTVGAFRAFVARTGHRTLAERRGSARVWAGDRWSSRSGASWRQPGFPQDEAHPVVCVSWDDAAAFCDSAGGRLLTEAEWERAARGGNEGMVYAWGSGRTPMRGGRAQANVPDEAARRAFHWWVFEGYDDGHVYTSAVGCFPAGGFGLHDMAGNAA
jgi:formylglycine-generating enzyme required for sulfatase activity